VDVVRDSRKFPGHPYMGRIMRMPLHGHLCDSTAFLILASLVYALGNIFLLFSQASSRTIEFHTLAWIFVNVIRFFSSKCAHHRLRFIMLAEIPRRPMLCWEIPAYCGNSKCDEWKCKVETMMLVVRQRCWCERVWCVKLVAITLCNVTGSSQSCMSL